MVAGRVGRSAGLAALALLAGGGAHQLDAHPLHTTLSEVTAGPLPNTVRAVIRVFADDFGKVAAAGPAPRTGLAGSAATLAYLRRAFVISDRAGHVLPLRPCGTRQTADLLWLCVEVTASAKQGLMVRNAILCELYGDQVNIVRSSLSGATTSILFTRNDRAKPLH